MHIFYDAHNSHAPPYTLGGPRHSKSNNGDAVCV